MYLFNEDYSLSRDLIAGTIASIVSYSISAPLERLKLQLQLKGPRKHAIVTTFTELIKKGGIRSFWAGNGANLLKVIPQMIIRTVVLKNMMDVGSHNSLYVFLSGAVAGLTAQTITYPMEVLRIRMSVANAGYYRGILHAAQHIYKTGGKKVFLRGILLSSVLSGPYFGTKFALANAILHTVQEETLAENRKTITILAAGVSSTVAMLLVYPGFLIRTILQIMPTLKAKSVLVYTLKKRGIRGLYSGMGVSTIRVFQVAGVNYIVFIQFRHFLQELGH